jgi:Stage II sporulation protein E (SpoIIE)
MRRETSFGCPPSQGEVQSSPRRTGWKTPNRHWLTVSVRLSNAGRFRVSRLFHLFVSPEPVTDKTRRQVEMSCWQRAFIDGSKLNGCFPYCARKVANTKRISRFDRRRPNGARQLRTVRQAGPAHHAQQGRGLREQVRRAAGVQRSLLADVSGPVGEFRLASMYLPCEALGGDFYDLSWRRDCAVLLVSDVMGHGVEAALITMLVKAAFQDCADKTGEPAEILRDMNGRLHRTLPERVYVAATVARLPLEGSDVQLANAGLPYPFLLRAAPRRVDELRQDGVPLGLFDGQRDYDVGSVSLSPGDVLLIASDGLGCVESGQDQWFEDHRLRQVLEDLAGQDGRRVVDRLVAEVIEFGHDLPLPDDINLIAVSRNGFPRSAETDCQESPLMCR